MKLLTFVRRSLLPAIAGVCLVAVFTATATATPGSHTQGEVNASVEKGVAYLDSQQNPSGSIGVAEEVPIAQTGMALVAYSVLANGSFSSLSATYQEHVKKAIEYLLGQQEKTSGYWADQGFYETYSTGIALAGLAPFAGVNAAVPAAIKKGREFLEGEFQGTAFTGCSSEEGSATAYYCGGWNYDADPGRSDESNTGFAMFGLHQSGGIPAAVLAQNPGWQHHVQAIKSNPFASRNDGGAGYEPECASSCSDFSSNANDTGSMLFGFGYDGLSLTNEGVKAGVTFGEDLLNEYELEKEVKRTMIYHSGESEDGTCEIGKEGCDWGFGEGEGGYHYSLFALTKGLGEYVGQNLKEAGNWYAKVVDLLLTQQEKGGSWPADVRDDANTVFATALAVSSLGLVGVEAKISTSLSGEGKSGPKIAVGEGAAVTDQATLKGTETQTATGTVTYTVYSDSECSKVAAQAGTVTVKEGAVPASNAETLPKGTFYWQASYSGDETHSAASTTCGEEQLQVGSEVPSTSLTTSLASSEGSGATITVNEGTAVSDNATLSGANAASAGGNVDYKVYSDVQCMHEVADAGTVPVTNGAVPSSSAETLPAGTYYWRAAYSGDANNAPSSSECGSEVETVKGTTTSCTASGTGRFRVKKEVQTLTDKLSTNLSAKQTLKFRWNKEGKHELVLTSLTAASCTVVPHRTTLFGQGTASVDGTGGYAVKFAITVNSHGKLVLELKYAKGKEHASFHDAAKANEVISHS